MQHSTNIAATKKQRKRGIAFVQATSPDVGSSHVYLEMVCAFAHFCRYFTLVSPAIQISPCQLELSSNLIVGMELLCQNVQNLVLVLSAGSLKRVYLASSYQTSEERCLGCLGCPGRRIHEYGQCRIVS